MAVDGLSRVGTKVEHWILDMQGKEVFQLGLGFSSKTWRATYRSGRADKNLWGVDAVRDETKTNFSEICLIGSALVLR